MVNLKSSTCGSEMSELSAITESPMPRGVDGSPQAVCAWLRDIPSHVGGWDWAGTAAVGHAHQRAGALQELGTGRLEDSGT